MGYSLWVIYYDNDETYSGAPERAPERGVQAIVQEDESTGWYALSSADYYVWLGEGWAAVDVFGLWDYLAAPGWKRVLFGRTISNEEYARIYHAALQDVGHKSALRFGERQP